MLLLAVACSSGKTGHFAVASRTPKAASAAKAESQSAAPARIGVPSAARLFAGTNSVTGALLHYCKGSTCVDPSPGRLSYLVAQSGSFAMFTIGKTPVTATAEVRTRPSETPSTVALNPSDMMVFDYGLGPGRYLVDLVVHWRTEDARWRFGMTVAS